MKKTYKKLMAVDPAAKSGIALFDIKTRTLERLLLHDIKEAMAGLSPVEGRLAYIQSALEVVRDMNPCVLVVESGFVGKGMAASLLMEGRRWVWEQAAFTCGVEFGDRVAPAEWQAAIGCWKGCDPKAVARGHVIAKYGDRFDIPQTKLEKYLKQRQDLCDAICIGEVASWRYMVNVRRVN